MQLPRSFLSFYAVIVVLMAISTSCIVNPGYLVDHSRSTFQGLFDSINKHRARGTACSGLPSSKEPAAPLTEDDDLQDAAQALSIGLLEHNKPSRPGRRDRLASNVLDEVVASFLREGGNIPDDVGALFSANYDDPETISQTWMRNPRYCSIIMNPLLTKTGISFTSTEDGPGSFLVQLMSP